MEIDKKTQEALIYVAERMAADPHHADRRATGVMDFMVKIGVGISTAGILALIGAFISMSGNISKLTWQQGEMTKQLASLQRSADAPRFTKDDFYTEMRMYDKRIATAEALLSECKDFIAITEKRLYLLDQRGK